jgi:S-disulfanyl-L-cysteine oxidoreductase SoxD
MSMHKLCFVVATLSLIACPVAASAQVQVHYGFGTPVTTAELSKYFDSRADGLGLPPGSGTAAEGAKVYAENCAVCHGDHLQGNPAKGIGGDKLLGGRGTLASKGPVKTVESYWPYGTTLFDYVKRAMPFSSPGSLNNDQIYSVVAYILSQGKIIKASETINAKTLPKVEMPNRNGFIPDPRPELELYR